MNNEALASRREEELALRKEERTYNHGFIDGKKFGSLIEAMGEIISNVKVTRIREANSRSFIEIFIERSLEEFQENYAKAEELNKGCGGMYNQDLISLLERFGKEHERLCLKLYNSQNESNPIPELLKYGEKPEEATK